MNLSKLLAASAVLLSALVAAPNAYAHVTYYRAAPGAATAGVPAGYDWTGGTNADVLALQADLQYAPNNLGYEGVHSATNDRYIATGLYAATAIANTPATSLDFAGTWGGVVTSNAATLLGQTFSYNSKAANATHQMSQTGALSVDQGSWLNGVSSANTGLSSGSPHFSTGSGNPELNLLNAGANSGNNTKYVNITVGDDPLFAGTNQLAFRLYQGWGDLNTLIPLYTGIAATAGADLGVTLELTGRFASYQTAANAGEYTLVFGDVSNPLNLAAFDGHYRYALDISSTAAYSTVVSAVPVPGAVWLFGSAMAGLIGFGRRKAAA